jgi:hypothetical protein
VLQEASATDDFIVWPEHEEVVGVYCICARQWRATSGGVIGLDLNVALAVMQLYDVQDRCQCLEDLRIMEDRAVEIMNQKAQSQAKGRRG